MSVDHYIFYTHEEENFKDKVLKELCYHSSSVEGLKKAIAYLEEEIKRLEKLEANNKKQDTI